MADIDSQTAQLSDSIETGAGADRSLTLSTPSGVLGQTADTIPPVIVSGDNGKEHGAHNEPPEPSLLSTDPGSSAGVSNSVASSVPAATGQSAPPVKKFSSMNINKKFLEKASSSPVSGHGSAVAVGSKMSGSIAKPTPQTAVSHSRLVTTKLTASLSSSSTVGPGWSRPNSAALPAMSPATTPPIPPPPAIPSSAAPQLPHVGKVIQPVSRTSVGETKKRTDHLTSSTKPAWGNVRNAAGAISDGRVQSDFPTAAEVAEGRAATKAVDDKATAAQKQAMLETAATFRGVNLDPNAHHWDEMEEDDDNFLGGVIEFGDGTQYQIQPVDGPSAGDPSSEAPQVPVSKEERFADDFDRSWPRSRESPADGAQQDLPPHAQPTVTIPPDPSQPSYSPQDSSQSRVLFNERSNRLEPYSNSHWHSSGPSSGPGPSGYLPSRRGSHSEFPSTSPIEGRSIGREQPPHGPPQSVQLLQKSGTGLSGGVGVSMSSRAPGHRPFGSSHHEGDRGRRDHNGIVSPSLTRASPRDFDNRWEHQHTATSPKDTRDSGADDRGRGGSVLELDSPLPLPLGRDRSRDAGRQLPPHLSRMPPPPAPGPPQRRMSSRDAPRSPSTTTSQVAGQSPVLSFASASSPALETPPVLPAGDLDEIRKAAMHSAAERAKQRRKEEEEQREREKERAKKKAAELAAEAEKLANVVQVLETNAAVKGGSDKTTHAVAEAEVVKFIEQAVRTVGAVQPNGLIPDSSQFKPPFQRNPSLRPIPRVPPGPPLPHVLRRPSYPPVDATPSSAAQAESWRKTAAPPVPQQLAAVVSPPVHPPPPPVFPGVDVLTINSDEELEVVDFCDLGKLVGDDSTQLPPKSEMRQTVGDFFDDSPSHRDSLVRSKSNAGVWRRPGPSLNGMTSKADASDHRAGSVDSIIMPTSSSITEPLSSISTMGSITSVETATTTNAAIIEATQESKPTAQVSATSTHVQPLNVSMSPSRPPSSDLPSSTIQSVPGHPHGSQRLASFYKEAPMSALNDTMSRIKGALDGMQSLDTVNDMKGKELASMPDPVTHSTSINTSVPAPQRADLLVKAPKWMPPALRSRPPVPRQVSPPLEVFDLTRPEPPRSPKPAWNAFVVRLPRFSRSLELVPKKQMRSLKGPPAHVRWDILSWDPPVEGMTRRDLSVNEVLFRKPPMYKGKFKMRVLLPSTKAVSTLLTTPYPKGHTVSTPSGPTVNLPPNVGPPKRAGPFGRTRADEALSWRKPAAAHSQNPDEPSSPNPELSTVSRSPPPELSSAAVGTFLAPKVDVTMSDASNQQKSPNKLPLGSDVAFYRDSRLAFEGAGPKPLVNFTVSSELDAPQLSNSTVNQSCGTGASRSFSSVSSRIPDVSVSSSNTSSHGQTTVNIHAQLLESPKVGSPSLVLSTSEGKGSDESRPSIMQNERRPVTPPSQSTSTPWTKSPLAFSLKDSPARAPDPEHLKIVWSQASDKAELPAMNSLKGIADDLTAVPFTLQDVKSEDGGTPPPSGPVAPPSRMSVHEVTRAFQQVPPSPAMSSAANGSRSGGPFSPPLSSPPYLHVMRPPPYGMPPTQPMPNPPMRPAYPGYPSSMMSNSPPAIMYSAHPMTSSPVQNRIPVNGHSPPFGQPVWMSIPGHTQQQPGTIVRGPPPTSPYPAQMMAYPGVPGMYPAPPPPGSIHSPPLQASGAQPTPRGRGVPHMSPVMARPSIQPVPGSMPMYSGSPVLVHAPPAGAPPSHSPYTSVSIGAGQGQVRSGYENVSVIQPMHHAPLGHLPPHSVGYTPVPPTSFVRPTW